MEHICTKNCGTVTFKDKDIPRWWYLWFKIVRQQGITGEIPVIQPFEPDWAIFHLMYKGLDSNKKNLSIYLEKRFHELKKQFS